MKTDFFKKSSESNNSEMMVMSKEEMKSVNGGVRILKVVDTDGSVHVIIVVSNG